MQMGKAKTGDFEKKQLAITWKRRPSQAFST